MVNPVLPVGGGGEKLGFGIWDDAGTATAVLTRVLAAATVGTEDTESGSMAVASMTLHDAPDVAAEGPVKVGGYAKATAPTSVADGDRVNAWFDLDGAQMTKLRGSTALDLGKAEDAAHASGDVGVMALSVHKDTAAALGADGDYAPLETDANGRLHVILPNIVNDDAVFTPGTTPVAMAGFEADESATDSVDEGDAGAARMTLDRKLITTPQPHTSGGLTPFKSLDIDESEEEVKGSAGQLYFIHAMNTTNAPLFLKFYDGTAAGITVGSDTPVLTFMVPGNNDTDGSGFVASIPMGFAFATGITVACTTAAADADTGAPGAGACLVNIGYK